MAEYATFIGRFIDEVRCKGDCRTVIGTAREPRTKEYTELVIAMRDPDGQLSFHETGMCRACKERILREGPRPGELDAIYDQDKEQWEAEALRAGYPQPEVSMMLNRFAARVPTAAIAMKGRGEA